MESIRQRLAGGDLRSTGCSDEVAAEAACYPELLADLVECLQAADPVVAMRAADALEKATARQPHTLQAFAGPILAIASQARRKEIRWHMAQLLPRIHWDPAQQEQVLDILYHYLEDGSRIVVTFSLQALADLALKDPRLQAALLSRLAQYTASPHGSIRSRALRLHSLLQGRQKPRRPESKGA